MRVTIDESLCQGHGLCVRAAADMFVMNDREHATAVSAAVPPDLEDDVRRAAAACPEEAISID